jgi:geranylgeranyl diphosphate synthase type II
MSQQTMKTALEEYRRELEDFFSGAIQDEAIPASLAEAMRYSLLAGGKRVRPVLCLVWHELLGGNRDEIMGFATALELIHTYSLVHDDLPAMDNDAVRRGQPSNHARFGEPLAILAGDGLLTEAMHLMLASETDPSRVIHASREVAQAAGPRGMVGGQVLDMALSGAPPSELEQLKTMHGMKTGAMLRAACTSGAILAGASASELERAESYGANLGLAFQVADDILDIVGDEAKLGKPVGSDERMQKSTYPGLLGLEQSRRMARDLSERAVQALDCHSGDRAEFLADLARYVVQRTE